MRESSEGADGVGAGRVVGRHVVFVILAVGIIYSVSIAKVIGWCIHERWYYSR